MSTACPDCGSRVILRIHRDSGDVQFFEAYDCGAAHLWGMEPGWYRRCPQPARRTVRPAPEPLDR